MIQTKMKIGFQQLCTLKTGAVGKRPMSNNGRKKDCMMKVVDITKEVLPSGVSNIQRNLLEKVVSVAVT